MKQIQPDVWETQTQSPFPGLKTHAYLLTRDDGNVLFYNTGHAREVEKFAELGGVSRQYLSHEDELGDTLNLIADRYQSILAGHRAEREAFARFREPDLLFDRPEVHLGNIELIPTPGHSPGSTCFLVHSPTGKHYLFTGDTLFLDSTNQWVAGFIDGSHNEDNRHHLAASLQQLKSLRPDVVFGSAYTGDFGYQEMAPGDWPGHVDRALEQLLSGERAQ